MPAIGASTTGVATRRGPSTRSRGRAGLTAPLCQPGLQTAGAGAQPFLAGLGFAIVPVQVTGVYCWLGRELIDRSPPLFGGGETKQGVIVGPAPEPGGRAPGGEGG